MALTPASILADYSSGISTQGATLQIKTEDKRVGIGTTNPQGTLQVGTAITMGSGIITATAADFSGNLTVGGVLTYEDVTNVDSVGVITARAGLKSGNLQFGVTGGTEIDTSSGNLTLDSAGGTTTVDDYLTVTDGAIVTGILTATTVEQTQTYPTIRPTLDLNFAATKTLDRRITFTRDSLGTYYDELGVLKYASNNVPRFDHNPTTGESLGLLIEESRTNLITNSNAPTGQNFNWSTNTTNDNVLTPDGRLSTVRRLTSSGSGSYTFRMGNTTAGSPDTTYTGSVWIRTVSGTVQINVDMNDQGTHAVALSTDWVRFEATGTTSSSGGGAAANYRFLDIFATTTADLYVWGAQIEEGAFATSYIPTSGSTVTRGSDQAKITGTNFTDFYNQTEGTFSITAKPNEPNNGSNYYFIFEAASSSDYSNAMSIGKDSGNTYRMRPMKFSNLSDTSLTYTTNSFNAAIAGSGSGDGVVAFNGTIAATSTGSPSGTQDHNVLHIGNRFPGSSGGHYYGTIKSLKYYSKRLTNAQLQGLTA